MATRLGLGIKSEDGLVKRLGEIEPIAVLYQVRPLPPVDGIAKPPKPGGFADSGADIAFGLRTQDVAVCTLTAKADPSVDLDWVFPDDEEGMRDASNRGAQTLWLNCGLYSGHPAEAVHAQSFSFVGQRPSSVARFDDKLFTNRFLAAKGLRVASSAAVDASTDLATVVLPAVVKPIRGRGSEGVAIATTRVELCSMVHALVSAVVEVDGVARSQFGPRVMVEEFLPGEELTVTVMPPGVYELCGRCTEKESYWALPPVRRFDHVDGVAPYNGIVPVARNSVVLSPDELRDPHTRALMLECERAAKLVEARAPIRIDCRRGDDRTFRLFDLNMKPNMTGPGRPGRDDQDSLVALSARAVGWSYGDLLLNIAGQAWRAASNDR